MKDKIKELRVKIDGLSQLVKELKPQKLYRLDISTIPDGLTIEEHLHIFREHGFSLEDGSKGIEVIPQVYKEISHCYDSLILAKAWLGKVLGELGQETPYKNDGKRKDVKDIEETADTYKDSDVPGIPDFPFGTETYIEKIDWLREEIKNLEIPNFLDLLDTHQYNRTITWLEHNIYNCLSEARFWLGFELQRIKENEEK